jgi:hypothetical protein
MEWPEKWFTAKAFWVDGFKRDPEALEWFLRTWRLLATWLIEGEKQTLSVEEVKIFSALPSRPEDVSPEEVWVKALMLHDMTNLLVTWADLTIHADSNVLLRVINHVSWLRPDRRVKFRDPEALSRDWDEARLLFQRLWLQMEIRKTPKRRKGSSKYLEHIQEIFKSGRVLDGSDLVRELEGRGVPISKDNVHQVMHRLRRRGHPFGKVGKRGYGNLTDRKS